MKTRKEKILDLLRDDIHFWIPLYQRNFNWTNAQFEFLYEDLLALEERDSHYFGPIVFLKKEKTKLQGQNLSRKRFDCYEIIDGQQRITTISIILLLLLSKKQMPENFKSEIRSILFWNPLDFESKKLSLHSADEIDFKSICKNLSISDVKSTAIKNCWGTFNQHINYELEKNPLFLIQFFAWLKKLEIILIETENEEDPRIIFERINTTGLILSNYDKLKNSIFLKYNREEQEQINPHFLYIEAILGITSDSKKADEFLKHFYCSLFFENPKSDLYYCFHQRLHEQPSSYLIEFVQTITEYAFVYARYISASPFFEIVMTHSKTFDPKHVFGNSDFNPDLPTSKTVRNIVSHYRSFQFKALTPFLLLQLWELHHESESRFLEIEENLLYGLNRCLTIVLNQGQGLDFINLCLFLINNRRGILPYASASAKFPRIFFGTRKDLLLVRYLCSALQYSDSKVQQYLLSDSRDATFLMDNDFASQTQKLLSGTEVLSVPGPLGITFSPLPSNPADISRATKTKPYHAIINNVELDVSTWKELKMEAIQVVLRNDDSKFNSLISNRKICASQYCFVSTDPSLFDGEYIEIQIKGTPIYINQQAQSASAILKLLSEFCNRTTSIIECL